MLLFIPPFFSHLHSLFLLLIVNHYLYVPLYSSVLSVIYIPCLFFCFLDIIYLFIFNIPSISHYLHARFYSSVFQSSTFPVSSSDYQSLSTRSFIFFLFSIPCLFFCSLDIIYMLIFNIPFISHYLHARFYSLFFSHLHSLFILLIISNYLHVSLYFSAYQSLSTRTCSFLFLCFSVIYIPCLFFWLSVIIYMFLYIFLFISHYLRIHAPFYSSVFQSSTFPVYSSDYQ